tara:strand:- start:520 stop:639 length:120 start_codon:yes stop_codon:yes gene_type:complete
VTFAEAVAPPKAEELFKEKSEGFKSQFNLSKGESNARKL